MADLKPCPFCGGEAVISRDEYVSAQFRHDKNSRYIGQGKDIQWTATRKRKTYLYEHKDYKVHCTTPRCFARYNNVIFHDEAEAVEAWNRRGDHG